MKIEKRNLTSTKIHSLREVLKRAKKEFNVRDKLTLKDFEDLMERNKEEFLYLGETIFEEATTDKKNNIFDIKIGYSVDDDDIQSQLR